MNNACLLFSERLDGLRRHFGLVSGDEEGGRLWMGLINKQGSSKADHLHPSHTASNIRSEQS